MECVKCEVCDIRGVCEVCDIYGVCGVCDGAYVLQAELQLLLVGSEVLGHLHRQVVQGEDAVEERQHLVNRKRETRWVNAAAPNSWSNSLGPDLGPRLLGQRLLVLYHVGPVQPIETNWH